MKSSLQGLFIGDCREKLPKKTETVHVVGKEMVLPLIFCSWRWWNSFWGSYEGPSLCHTTHELIFPLQPVSLADWPLVSFPLCLWFWDVCCFHTGVWWRCVCAHLYSWCDLKRESPPIKILQGLQNNRKPQCRLETYSQKCPEQQWKASISHLGCLPNSLSFSPGFFSLLLLLLTSWFQLFYPGCWW